MLYLWPMQIVHGCLNCLLKIYRGMSDTTVDNIRIKLVGKKTRELVGIPEIQQSY
jgi:hypothetical protein